MTGHRALALDRAILNTVAYADVFDYPLTPGEVHRYLIGLDAGASEVLAALNGQGLVPERLVHRDGLYSLPGREEIVERRRKRSVPAGRLWKLAFEYGRSIAGLPFVRMVAVTGSLAANNVDPDADVDYLIVTEPGRLWLCRALVIGLVRRAARRGITLCPNYLLTESALELRQRDLYTAWELAQMVPIAGLDTYRVLRRKNNWASAFLPNAEGLPWHPEPEGNRAPPPNSSRWSLVAERILGSPAGDWLERWERTRKVRRFTQEAREVAIRDARSDRTADPEGVQGEAEFSANCCKGHLGTHRREVMARYRVRLEALGLGG